jgi:hypothetical protein
MSSPSSDFPDQGARPGESRATVNPFAKGLNVTVSVPQSLEFRLVDASALEEYEVWSLISSILSSAVLGFLVAYFQDPKDSSLLYTAIVFAVIFVISIVTAFSKRSRLRRTSKRITMGTTELDEHS